MATPARNDSLAALSKDLVSSDPKLQAQLRKLVSQSIAMAMYTMEHGSMADRMQLMKHMTPHMLEALRTTNQSAADEEKKLAYERIRRLCRGEDEDGDL